MLRNCDHAPSFEDARQTIDPADRFAQGTAAASRPAAITLATICNALRDGLAAQRQYEHLKTRGVSHDRALRAALGIGIPASETHVSAQYRSRPPTDPTRTNETVCARRVSARVNPAPHLPASARVGNLAYLKRSFPAGKGAQLVGFNLSLLSCRESSAACAKSQSLKATIFGNLAVAFEQTIQYAKETGIAVANGRTRRPPIKSHAASAVRANTTPCPSTAASIAMLAWFRTGPRERSTPVTPAKSSQRFQSCRLSTCKSATRLRSEGSRSGLRPLRSFGLQTGKSSSAQRRVTWSPDAVPSP
jgi:hypothetical protein